VPFRRPVADITVLGVPDEQYLSSEAAAFEALVESARPLVVANAPTRSRDAPGEDAARVLSLDGRWRDGRRAVGRMACFLA
jgi:hypothetical protein